LAARALARARETSDARAEVLAFEEIGDLAREGGHFPAATEAYDNGWRIAQSIAPEGDLVYELAWRRALLLLDAGDMEGAEQLAQRALELADRSSDSREAGNALRTLSRIQHRRNCGPESLASLEAALEKARSIQAPYDGRSA
jgi:triphosphoribosyl-dephospho-CoA synthetase